MKEKCLTMAHRLRIVLGCPRATSGSNGGRKTLIDSEWFEEKAVVLLLDVVMSMKEKRCENWGSALPTPPLNHYFTNDIKQIKQHYQPTDKTVSTRHGITKLEMLRRCSFATL